MFGHDEQQQPTQNDTTVAPVATDNAAPATDTQPSATPADSAATPFITGSEPSSPAPDSGTDSLSAASTPAGNDDLLNIKQKALKDLSPLVGHLNQTPEEKFRTTMMMIQASDDESLISSAYEAAQNITDEKARAQALLDIINEINYFTQQHNS